LRQEKQAVDAGIVQYDNEGMKNDK